MWILQHHFHSLTLPCICWYQNMPSVPATYLLEHRISRSKSRQRLVCAFGKGFEMYITQHARVITQSLCIHIVYLAWFGWLYASLHDWRFSYISHFGIKSLEDPRRPKNARKSTNKFGRAWKILEESRLLKKPRRVRKFPEGSREDWKVPEEGRRPTLF